MPLPSRLQVINPPEYEACHRATLELLEQTGLLFHHEEVCDIFKAHGAKVDGQLVCLPAGLVEDSLQQVPSRFKWRARNDSRSRTMGSGNLLQPAAGPVYVHDLDGCRRPGTLADYADFQKIYQALPTFDLVGMIPCEPEDVPQSRKHLYLMREILRHTDKPVNGFMTKGDQARAQLDMMAIAAGGEQALQRDHYIGVSIGATSPLTYSRDPLETLLHYVRRNQMVHLLTAPLAGVSAPLNMIETVVLQNAELLAGIVLAQLVKPGAPCVYGPSATAADMKTGAYVAGTPEGMLINIANIQLAVDYYHIPARAMCGLTDAKTPDAQAGYETMQNLIMGMLAGSSLLNEAAGVLDSILTVSYEKTIIDAELVERVRRMMQGIEGADRRIDLTTIREVGHGGNFLLHDSTLERCRERWRAPLSFSDTFQQWQAEGGIDIARRANRRCRAILAEAPPTLADPALVAELDAYVESELKHQ